MTDRQIFNESLKILQMTNNQGKWKVFVDYYLEKHGGKLVFSANLKRLDTPLLITIFQNLLQPKLQNTGVPFYLKIIAKTTYISPPPKFG